MLGEYPFLPKIPKTGRSLDSGCGDGRNTVFLQNLGFESWGCEISKASIEALKIKFSSCNFAVGKNIQLPFEPNYFDLIVAWNSIYYIENNPNPTQLRLNLNEAFRVLNKNNSDASLIISIPCPSSFIFSNSKLICKEDGILVQKIINDPFKLRNGTFLSTFESKKSMQQILNLVGFSQVFIGEELGEWFGYNYNWWVAVCKL